MGKVYKTMQGKLIDMEKLMRQNELMPAVGNVRVNARGDELGLGGKIIKRREDNVQEYYDRSQKAKQKEAPVKETAEYSVQEAGAKTNKRGKNEGSRNN